MILYNLMTPNVKIDSSNLRAASQMSFTQAVALLWVGSNWSRTLFVPCTTTYRMFANGAKMPTGTLTQGIERFDTWNQFVSCFETDHQDNNEILDICFDEIGKMLGCSEDYLEFDRGCFHVAPIPPGLAITHMYSRGE